MAQKSVVIKKLFHRDNHCLGIFFDKDWDVIQEVKKIPEIKFSNTNKCWYVPLFCISPCMKLFIPIPFLFLFSHFALSQSSQVKSKHYNFSSIVGISRAKFEVTGISTEEYPTLEVRLGGGISRSLSRRVQINTGLNICFRAKRESYLIDGNYFGKGILSLLLDETASKKITLP